MRSMVFQVLAGGSGQRTISLRGARMRLGRGAGNEVVLSGSRVQPIHAVVVRRDHGLELMDLTGDGVELNGRLISRAGLQLGDDLRIGEHRLRLDSGRYPEGEGAPSEATQVVRNEAAALPAPPVVLKIRTRSGWRQHRLPQRQAYLGKSADNDIVIDSPDVSRWHCRVAAEGPAYLVEDLHSTNGTFVNGVRVRRSPVSVGGEIRLGSTPVFLLGSDLAGVPTTPISFCGLVGGSAPMMKLYRDLERVAESAEPVVLSGETGTGKELAARALHERSSRRGGAFVPINCGALPRELVESELFGHERGAFSGATNQRRGLFEEADGGTLFLDEVAELSPETQAKLLRVLESGEVRRVGANRACTVDTRVVAACNQGLLEMVRGGRFRRDLYHRLCVVELRLPPLRERLDDLPALTRHFLGDCGKSLRPTALQRLEAYLWPGNIRELRNVLRRASLLSPEAMIGPDHLHFAEDVEAEAGSVASTAGPLEELERRALLTAVHRHGGNKTAAARDLGIARSTLFEKLRRHRISVPRRLNR